MSLLIGFEFEFGWFPSIVRKDFSVAKNIRKACYFNQCVYDEVKISLQEYLNEYYTFIDEIKEDSTIRFNAKYYDGHYGVEVVTSPMKEEIAGIFLKNFILWMINNSNVSTNETCSLHVNISFADSFKTLEIDYLKLLNIVPQLKILSLFNRDKNKYCEASENKKFSLEKNCRISKERNYSYWVNKINKNKIISVLTTPISFGSFSYNSKKEKIIEKFIFETKEIGLQFINEKYLSRLNSIGKNLAIVQKINPAGLRYFEFRMIGNTNYQLRYNDIFNTIEKYKECLRGNNG